MPDFFIVGHAKCGTTALYEMLRAHPQIFMPDFKEPMYFARNWDEPPAAPGEPRRFEQTGRRSETRADYLSCSPPPQLISSSARRPRSTCGHGSRRSGSQPRTRRADHRDPARARQLRALAAHADGPEPGRVRARPAAGDRARAEPARRARHPRARLRPER